MRYIHPDHLGTTRVLTDSVGNQVASFDFFPFGELAAQSGLTEEAPCVSVVVASTGPG